MINLIFSINLILGFGIIGGLIIMYCLRFVRPELVEERDIIGITLGLLYSVIIMIHGWRLDPILLFSQLIICALAGGAGQEVIRLRAAVLEAAEAGEQKAIKYKENIEVYQENIQFCKQVFEKLNYLNNNNKN